nr:immunoglobulin heavy chain junction region [Mus musculus]
CARRGLGGAMDYW